MKKIKKVFKNIIEHIKEFPYCFISTIKCKLEAVIALVIVGATYIGTLSNNELNTLWYGELASWVTLSGIVLIILFGLYLLGVAIYKIFNSKLW